MLNLKQKKGRENENEKVQQSMPTFTFYIFPSLFLFYILRFTF
jgi:hypothetical protein